MTQISPRDRPVDSADESPNEEFIQVTPEMIEAGVAVYVDFVEGGPAAKGLFTEGDLVSAIHQAMLAKREGRGSQRMQNADIRNKNAVTALSARLAV